jgi:hypothetical protein
MATTIKLKNSVTTTAAPSSLVQGEVATNITDKKVWVGDASSTPVQILGAGAPVAGTTGTFTGNTTVAGTFAANGGATLGDASGDALTINSSTVSIPNGLNFDSNTFVIDATNNRVGVGVASPATKFHVYESAAASVTATVEAGTDTFRALAQFKAKTTGSVATSLTLGAYADGGDVQQIIATGQLNINSGTSQPLVFTANASERMRISSTGNVGIGTSSPATKLQVVGTATFGDGTNGQLRLTSNASINYIDSLNNAGSAWQRMDSRAVSFNWFTAASGTPTAGMTLDSSGNLGLGVTPSAWGSGFKALEVGRVGNGFFSVGADSLQVANNYYYNGTNYIYAANGFAARYHMVTGQHQWYTAASGTAGNTITFTQAMTLDASGNLGIGTTSPSYQLQVGTYGTTADATLALGSTTSGTGTIRFGDGTSGTNANAGLLRYDHSANAMIFWTDVTERMRIDSSGNLLVGKTSATANGGDVQVSSGITFPATQVAKSNANTLDDYEEGTFTPTVSGVTLSSATGTYTKIGRQVFVSFDITWPTNTNTTAITIASLPFTPVANSGTMSVGYTTYANILSGVCGGAGIAVYGFNGNPASSPQNIHLSGLRLIASATYTV